MPQVSKKDLTDLKLHIFLLKILQLVRSIKLYNYTAVNLTDPGEIIREENVLVADTTIGLTSTGTPLLNVSNVSSWQDENEWHYSNTFRNNANGNGTYFIEPEHAGLTEWDKTSHSPIVGWAFDGLPIYGPYGYNRYASDGTLVGVDANDAITPIKSAFGLRTGQRSSGPLGVYTGEFVEDYTYDVALGGTAGYVGHSAKGGIAKYNMRWGVTPESPDTPIYFYVATIDINEKPMFPYAIGGTQTASPTIF